MLRRWIPMLGVAAVVLLSAEPASARLRDRLANRRGYSDAPVYYQATPTATVTTSEFVPTTAEPVYSERPSRRFGRRAPVTSGATVYTPTAPAGAATGPMPDTERTSFYPSTAPSNAVLLKVRLPADAELRIEGKRMTTAGASRQFLSPTLDPNKEYTYELQAKWMENGKEVSRTRTKTFKPGQELEFNFLSRMPTDSKTPDTKTP